MLQLQALAPESPPPAVPDPLAETFGCGWFDSSWELQQGLQVTEHRCADSAARVLGLDGWLMLQELVAKQQRGCAMIPG